ncbi:MAG: NADH-quinone oxidoreductase subunit D [Bacillota bacterium]
MSEEIKEITTQEFKLNMGPQHPSTHGVYRAILTMDGEYIVDVENVMGYLHRGMEKIAENRSYTKFIPYTDRLDYLAAALNNWAYVGVVEKLMQIEVPERAEYMRVILGELQRIASHLVYTASFAIDLSGWTAWLYMFRDREKILDLFEMATGARLTLNSMRIGGMPSEFPPEFFPALEKLLDELPGCFEEYDGIITGNEIFQARTKNIGVMDVDTIINYGLGGPNLRASGLKYDLRKDMPYSVYDRFDFEVPVGEIGDCFDRYLVRMQEMRQSTRIIRQALEQMPEGPIMAKVPKVIKPPKGEAYYHIEGAKGWLGFYLVSDGSTNPYRLHIHSPSFVSLGAFPEMARGGNVQDLVSVIASIDIVLGEVDR